MTLLLGIATGIIATLCFGGYLYKNVISDGVASDCVLFSTGTMVAGMASLYGLTTS